MHDTIAPQRLPPVSPTSDDRWRTSIRGSLRRFGRTWKDIGRRAPWPNGAYRQCRTHCPCSDISGTTPHGISWRQLSPTRVHVHSEIDSGRHCRHIPSRDMRHHVSKHEPASLANRRLDDRRRTCSHWRKDDTRNHERLRIRPHPIRVLPRTGSNSDPSTSCRSSTGTYRHAHGRRLVSASCRPDRSSTSNAGHVRMAHTTIPSTGCWPSFRRYAPHDKRTGNAHCDQRNGPTCSDHLICEPLGSDATELPGHGRLDTSRAYTADETRNDSAHVLVDNGIDIGHSTHAIPIREARGGKAAVLGVIFSVGLQATSATPLCPAPAPSAMY